MHMNLFLDTKEVLQRLNRTAQAKQIKTDYKRQITDTRNRLERAQSMNSSLYNDYADGLLNERDYLFAKQKYVKEAENLAQKLLAGTPESLGGGFCPPLGAGTE